MSNFYLTLPSNNGSVKYFPGNANNSWKNRLDKRLDLDGQWDVGMSNISLPHDSPLLSHLKGLKDSSFLMKSYREVQDKKGDKDMTDVTYGDIKDML